MADGTPRVRVGNFMGGALIALAFLFDLIQFLVSFLHVVPWVGNAIAFVVALFITCFAYITFGIWFALLRVNYFTGKQAALKILTLIGTLGLELIPLIDALPAITAGVITMVIVSRIEDMYETSTTALSAVVGGKADMKARELAEAKTEEERRNIQAKYARYASDLSRSAYEKKKFEESETQEKEQAEAIVKRDKTRRFLERFGAQTIEGNVENLDPTFKSFRTESDLQKYREWREKTASVNALSRGKNIDVPKPKGPQPDTYR